MQPDKHQNATRPKRWFFDMRSAVLVCVVGLLGVPLCFALISLLSTTTTDSSHTGEPSSNEPPVDEQTTNRMSIVACATCHGSHEFVDAQKPEDLWRSTYQIWSTDPHSNAYTSLWNNRSKRIVAALSRTLTGTHQDIINQKCVSCHSTVPWNMSAEMLARQDDFSSNLSMSNGVSCLSCHSQSNLNKQLLGQDWVVAHTKESWTKKPGIAKTADGLQDLTQLGVRAQTCMKCHIGSADRDVNHDLMAAGHPRLVFEYSSHLERLPKHWIETAEYSHSKCWSIGQIESAKFSLALLKQRASSAAKSNGAWPEFTEYNCHNCHHDLSGNWYLANETANAGKLSWGTWAFPNVAANMIGADIHQLRIEMEKAYPDLAKVESLAEIRTVLKYPSPLEHLYYHIQSQPRLNWDEVFAWYLAVNCCIEDSLLDGPAEEAILELMLELRTMLVQPFVNSKKRRQVEAEKMRQKMSEIRRIVLPRLRTNQNFPNRQP